MKGSEKQKTNTTIDNGKYGKRDISFETGLLAKQANGSVVTYLDSDTTILSTTTAGSEPKESFDFFPLTVDVEERMYAAGRIPGSFFRREGRPSTQAILACRLIDRPLRPLFSNEIRNEIQVIETILAVGDDDAYDVLAINAASCSTLISDIPFNGPVGAVRLALIDNQWVAFPTFSQGENAVFEIVVAGRIVESDVAIAMIEAGAGKNVVELVKNGATAPTEEVVAKGLEAAKPFIRQLCEAQLELKDKAGKEEGEFPLFPEYTEEVYNLVKSKAEKSLKEYFTIADKQQREVVISAMKERLHTELDEQFVDREREISAAFKSLQKQIVREKILQKGYRIDGRGLEEIRPLTAAVSVVPRVHGSALFERGETQVLGITTLNMLRMEQQIDSLSPETTKRYMHNYNFPPFSTGETGRVGSPKRREIGHGALAERALDPVIPSREEFPYAIRQVSEALGSNGSTSMASVCASTLGLLNAGVPLKASVAGIAMGLVSGEVNGKTKWATLTDILGTEDAFGDMDFKVAGTKDFITAIQLDTKLDGIPADILAGALGQAKVARLTILDLLNSTISKPNEMNPNAPRIVSMEIPFDKIGEVIGPKGKVIQEIQESAGVEISVEDDGEKGLVYISSTDGDSAKAAEKRINEIANPVIPEVGDTFEGEVVNITAFGAFIKLTATKDGLLHISELKKINAGERVNKVEDVLDVGQKVEVVVKEITRDGKISLTVAD
jgi:polyribonucleotide nucleotidyltransferase